MAMCIDELQVAGDPRNRRRRWLAMAVLRAGSCTCSVTGPPTAPDFWQQQQSTAPAGTGLQ